MKMRVVFRAVPWRRVALIVAAGALVVGATAGVVAAQGPAPAAAGAAAVPATLANLERDAVLARTIHADLTVWTRDGARTVRYARGEITAVGADSLTVSAKDGAAFAFGVTSTTRVRSRGKAIPFSSLEVGEKAMVFATRQADGSWSAFLIRCVSEPAPLATPAPSAPASPGA
jgi:hypothetical protein